MEAARHQRTNQFDRQSLFPFSWKGEGWLDDVKLNEVEKGEWFQLHGPRLRNGVG